MYTDQRHQARVHGSITHTTILQYLSDGDGTRAATTFGATELGPREPLCADKVEQGEVAVWVIDVDLGRVEGEDEGLGFE